MHKFGKIEMKLKKHLGLLEVFCIATGAMIGSGIFILPSIAYANTGPSVIISYIIASIIMIPTLFSKIELTTAMPKAGGDFFFIDRSMGPTIGTIGGLASWFSFTAKTAFALIGIGAFVQLFNPGITQIHIKIIAIAFCVVFTLLNMRGVKHTSKIQNILVICIICILVFYVTIGFFFIEPSNFVPFTPFGISPIIATSGLVFVSFMGLTKVCSVAEEVKNPMRNIPLGMILSWISVSILYFLVVFVTVGTLDNDTLTSSLMPVSLSGGAFLGPAGIIIMSFAAILAFITTANAGLLSSSRYPMAMSKDHLLPPSFTKISDKGIPINSLIFTSSFMIGLILFLDIYGIVKVASTLVLLLFIFINFAIIFMRFSNIKHYKPKYKAPFFPWLQIIGILLYSYLILQMGAIPLMVVGIFILCSLAWYYGYAHKKIKREYALLRIIHRITGEKSADNLLDEELREILIERDNVSERRFEDMIRKAVVLDFKGAHMPPIAFTKRITHILKDLIDVDEDKIFPLLLERENDGSVMIKPGVIMPTLIIPKRHKFNIILVRCKKGILFSSKQPRAKAIIFVISTSDEYNFYLHSLMWFANVVEEPDFDRKWMKAKGEKELRKIIIDGFRKRIQE